MKISAAIITLNEERNIGRCLDSLREVVDEVVVVDSGSADATERIGVLLNCQTVLLAATTILYGTRTESPPPVVVSVNGPCVTGVVGVAVNRFGRKMLMLKALA